MGAKWADFVKKAVSFDATGRSFKLEPGETAANAVGMYNAAYPKAPITMKDVTPGEPKMGGKYIPGRWYNLFKNQDAPKDKEGDSMPWDVFSSYVTSALPKGLHAQLMNIGKKFVGVTPRQSRRNIYHREMFNKYGPKYDRAKADAMSDADLDKALKARYAKLKGMGLAKGEFDNTRNYIIPPHKSYTPASDIGYSGKYDLGSVDSVIPVIRTEKDRGRTYYTVDDASRNPMSTSALSVGALWQNAMRLLNTFFHEGLHAAAPVARGWKEKNPPPGAPSDKKYYDRGKVDFWQGMDDEAKRTTSGINGYAASPWERLVAVSALKARMRVNGDDGSTGMGRRWATQELRRRSSQKGKDLVPSVYDADMNIQSLQNMLYDLWDKANMKNSTEADRKALFEFLDALDYDFEVAKNSDGDGRGKGFKTAVV